MLRIKICGLTNKGDAQAAACLGAAALGFVFAPSPRQIAPAKAKEIITGIPPWVAAVGVFVNETKEKIMQTAACCRLDWIQLHGEESPGQCRELVAAGMKVIKVFRPRTKDDLAVIPEYDVAGIHLDTYTASKAGGTGHVFNWDLAIAAKRYNKPLILAGGLNPGNIAAAVKKIHPYGVDVGSGVEEYPGKKDLEKMKRFMESIAGLVPGNG